MYSRGCHPLGRSWEEWAIRWWQWCSAEPYETNPAADPTGTYCNKNQSDKTTWFLAGTFGGRAERRCVIPHNRAILFPILTDRISFAEHPYLKNEGELSKYAQDDLNSARRLEAHIDGKTLRNLRRYRVRTAPFTFTVPPGEFNKANREAFLAVSDGFWIFLRPLLAGEHVLHFAGEKLLYDEAYLSAFKSPRRKFRVEVAYSILVQ